MPEDPREPLITITQLDRGRDAYRRRAWETAFAQLSAADVESPLGPEDLERLAISACLVGRDAEGTDLWARAHHEFLGRSDPDGPPAPPSGWGSASWKRGEEARASGWIARGPTPGGPRRARLGERGYLLLPEGFRTLSQGDSEGASAILGRAASIGERFGDRDLVALARHAQGRALIRAGKAAEGVALLDEAMVAVTTGEVSPMVAGDVYCSVISGCQEIFDWRRAQEWTAELARWCATQPDLVLYRGQCLLRRSEILQLRGDWSEALEEARRARGRLSEPPGQAGIGAAFCQLAELHRLRGELAEAEEAYRQASLHGRRTLPGLALLQLARGEAGAALAAIRRALDEVRDLRTRPGLLSAGVEVALAAGDVAAAGTAATELASIAADLAAPYLRALAGQATGAVLLAGGEPRAALAALREAETIWQELEAPHEAARTRLLIARGCRELGDEGGAELDLDAAGAVFRRLGATFDLARVERLRRAVSPQPAGGLTAREMQVLRLIAEGKTNRGIATQLRISEKTVARHVSNIFVKLGLSSRSAATAYAYEHSLTQTAPRNG